MQIFHTGPSLEPIINLVGNKWFICFLATALIAYGAGLVGYAIHKHVNKSEYEENID